MNKETMAVCWSDAGHILELMRQFKDVYKHYIDKDMFPSLEYDQGVMDGLDYAIHEICKCNVVKEITPRGQYIYLRDCKDGHEIAGSRFEI